MNSTNSTSSSLSANMGLQNLLNEPKRLKHESERVNSELEALVMENYKVFVENLTCSAHLQSEDKILSELSIELNHNIRNFGQQCFTFKDRVGLFVQHHKRNRKTLQHHMQLVELLEVPQLVDACIRNGFHDEALELAHFVNGLERRHILAAEVKSKDGKVRAGSGVVLNIVDEVHKTLGGLRHQLIHNLSENVTLPQEIQILSTLRKLDGLLIDRHLALGFATITDTQRDELRRKYLQNSEIRLQIDFLEARTLWFERNVGNQLSPVLSTSKVSRDLDGSVSTVVRTTATDATGSGSGTVTLGHYGKTMEILESRRSMWFAIITQFSALFLDNMVGSTKSDAVAAGTNNNTDTSALYVSPTKSSAAQVKEHINNAEKVALYRASSSLLNCWSSMQVHRFISDIKLLLPQIDEGASLRSVLEQTLYFSSRMSEVGLDFSIVALDLFKDVLVRRFDADMRKAVHNFKIMITTEKIVFDDGQDGVPSGREQIVPLYSAQDLNGSVDGAGSAADSDGNVSSSTRAAVLEEVPAPLLLMRFPPLAYLANCLLTSLNFIRECPLVSARDPLYLSLLGFFQSICITLAENAPTVKIIGERYLGDRFSRDLAKKTKSTGGTDGAGLTGVHETETMDNLYAEAVLRELLPHAMVCADAVFAGGALSVSIVNKLKKMRDTTSSCSNVPVSAIGVSSGSLKPNTMTRGSSDGYLVSNLPNLCESLEVSELSSAAQMLLENCWQVLMKQGCISASLLQVPATFVEAAAPTQAASSAVTKQGVLR